jgi:hypothetical protein
VLGTTDRDLVIPVEFVMTEPDYGTFDRAFRRVCGAFRLRANPVELEELSRTYFRVLADAPLEDVLAAGKTCLRTQTRFPKPAEWAAALPAAPVVAAADLRVMATPEREDYTRAEALRYQDEPCACWACQDAAVTDRPLRFVPDDVNGVLDRAIDTGRNRVVVTGHWTHGDELARWYVARDAFFACLSPIQRQKFALVYNGREPGSDDD